MPHLLLISSPLAIDAKRDLARSLTTTLLALVPGHSPERVTVEFETIASEDLARGGTLVFDGAPSDVYLRVSTPRLAERARKQLAKALTPPIVAAFGLEPGEPPDVIIEFTTYDSRDVIVADRSVPKKRGGPAIVPVLIGLGLVAGVYVAIDRLAQAGDDSASDTATPTTNAPVRSAPTIIPPGATTDATKSMTAMHAPAGEAVEAGQQDVRSSSSVVHDES